MIPISLQIGVYLNIHLSECENAPGPSMATSLQPIMWKTGGKSIMHFFQAKPSHICDLIESEQLHYFLPLVKPKESHYSQGESEKHQICSVPGNLIMSHPMTNRM